MRPTGLAVNRAEGGRAIMRLSSSDNVPGSCFSNSATSIWRSCNMYKNETWLFSVDQTMVNKVVSQFSRIYANTSKPNT